MESQEQLNSQEPVFILASTGEPFKSEQVARSAIATKKLDPNKFKVVSHGDGYAIVPKAIVENEKYYRVTFNAKAHPNDYDDVVLIVNGETLVMQREKEVIIPERFKECADHTKYPHFVQLPNQPRKIDAWIHTFPYQMKGEATKAEYEAFKKSGNNVTQKHIRQFGFDAPPLQE